MLIFSSRTLEKERTPAVRIIRYVPLNVSLGAVIASVILTCTAQAQSANSLASGGNSLIVSTSWLASHLRDPLVVVLDAAEFEMGEDKDYSGGHIPGARLLNSSYIDAQRDGLHLELPSVNAIRDEFEKLGISDSTLVVVYASTSPTASRVLFTLDYIGHRKFAFLDGGIAQWRAEGRSLTRDVPTFASGHITPHPQPEIVATADWIMAHGGHHGVALVDTRSDGEYLGTGNRHGIPSEGHIAGAHQLQWEQLFEPGNMKLKDRSALGKLYADRVAPGDTVVTYCWVGYRASMTYFIARYLGYPVKLYDGSYEDWRRRKLPVRAGSAP
jgi:thiosulfate/3-mercaptopyruvate sulfurtransferase